MVRENITGLPVLLDCSSPTIPCGGPVRIASYAAFGFRVTLTCKLSFLLKMVRDPGLIARGPLFLPVRPTRGQATPSERRLGFLLPIVVLALGNFLLRNADDGRGDHFFKGSLGIDEHELQPPREHIERFLCFS